MKKIGIIIFITTIVVGIVIANFLSIGNSFFDMPLSMSFGKIKGSGNLVTQKREVSNFNKIDVSGIFKVVAVAQKDFRVEVIAEENLLPLITTVVSGDTLKIDREQKFSTRNTITIRISAPNIEELSVSGVSKVHISNLDNESIFVDSSGASQIMVEGKTTRLKIDSSGASRVIAKNLKAKNATVDSSGASKSEVRVLETLNAELSGASRVYYSGDPSEITKKTSGVSRLKQLN